MTTKVKKIVFWAVVVVLVVGLGLWLKYTSFGVTLVTIIVGACGVVLGWIGRILYGKYIAREE